MRSIVKRAIVGIVFVAISMTQVGMAGESSSGDNMSVKKMFFKAAHTRYLIQCVAKDYLYVGSDIATTKAEKELKSSLELFDKNLKDFSKTNNDPKIKNLLLFIESSREDLEEVINKPFSLDNAQETIDIAEAMSEGILSIAKTLKGKLDKSIPVYIGSPRYDATQIAKYYIAYKSGIKDKNTVRNMKKVVSRFQDEITKLKSYQGNTPEMNRILNKVDKDWQIVHQFYLDIEEGDLPLIVYETTSKMNRSLKKYNMLLMPLDMKK